jgi:hypothetical protein
MKTICLALALALVGATWAHADVFHPPLGDLYLSFGPTAPPVVQGADRYREVPTFTLFDFYLLARVDFTDAGDPGSNMSNGITAWEASLAVPAGLTISTWQLSPATSADFGIGDNNWIVGTGGVCVQSYTQPVVLVAYSALLLAAAGDLRVALGPATPSTFDTTAPGAPGSPTPGWLGCPASTADLYPFTDRYLDGWIEVNPTGCVAPNCPVPTQQESWGAVKARFTSP